MRNMNEAAFTEEMRKYIVSASYDLYRGGMRFRTFRKSFCNEAYWSRSLEGGFRLKSDIAPSQGISDIFKNGRRYGTECATAMVIVFYKGTLDVFGNEAFDKNFGNIYLMNWQHSEKHLGVKTKHNPDLFLYGDCRYFANPDVNPLTPEWQGENTILLEEDKYYGHGIGIKTGEGIIAELNRNRVPGSDTSAYLMDTVTRPDFSKLYRMYSSDM